MRAAGTTGVEPPHVRRRRQLPGRPDLAYRDRKIGIEYEGDYHRVSASTFRSDIARRERFADEGWRTLRVTGDDLASPPNWSLAAAGFSRPPRDAPFAVVVPAVSVHDRLVRAA